MHLTALSSWATLLMAFSLVVLALWIWHDVMHVRPRGRHNLHLADLLNEEVPDDTGRRP